MINQWSCMIRFFIMILLLLTCQIQYAQVITGKVINENNENVANGFILLVAQNNPNVTIHFQQFKAGEFSVDVSKYKDNLLIIAKSNGFINDTLSLSKNKAINQDFLFLLKTKKTPSIALEEVVVVAKNILLKLKKTLLFIR